MRLQTLNYFIKPGYQDRAVARYFDTHQSDQKVHQPHAYALAVFLARRFGCKHIIDVGCGTAEKLIPYASEFDIIGIDTGENLVYCKANHPWGIWLDANLDQPVEVHIDEKKLRSSIIICADVIEHLVNPDYLLEFLHTLMEYSPAGIVTTPDRDRVRGETNFGPPDNPYHVREWNLSELERLLRAAHLRTEFHGYTINNQIDREKKTSMVILGTSHRPEIVRAPADFRVIALIAAYNEVDILPACLSHLRQQQIDAYIIDNWSTDGTFELAQQMLGQGVYGVERFPLSRSEGVAFEWSKLLQRKAELARSLDANWFIHNDADELREAPWPSVILRDAFFHVQRCGFNAIDFTVVNFHPTNDDFPSGGNLDHFEFYDFGKRIGHFQQIKAWRKTDDVDLVSSGGHNIQFYGKRIFPYKFLVRHYSFRSKTQASAKINQRVEGSVAERETLGWHSHLLEYTPDYQFIRDASSLSLYVKDTFQRDMLAERLSGVGILPDDFSA